MGRILVLFLLLAAISGCRSTDDDAKDYDELLARLGNPKYESVMNAAAWELGHCGDEKFMHEWMGAFKRLELLKDKEKFLASGGVKGLKKDVGRLLKSKDPVVRGFTVVFWGVTGDKSRIVDIAGLLNEKDGQDFSSPKGKRDWVRGRAAMALGLMGEMEYAPRMVELLSSPNSESRRGALAGLGYLGDKKHASAVARLLKDEDMCVPVLAVRTLAEMNASEYSDDIARLLDRRYMDEPLAYEVAFALVKFNAKDHAGALAKYLNDGLKGYIPAALALLGATEHIGRVAAMLKSESASNRKAAAIGIGHLRGLRLCRRCRGLA